MDLISRRDALYQMAGILMAMSPATSKLIESISGRYEISRKMLVKEFAIAANVTNVIYDSKKIEASRYLIDYIKYACNPNVRGMTDNEIERQKELEWSRLFEKNTYGEVPFDMWSYAKKLDRPIFLFPEFFEQTLIEKKIGNREYLIVARNHKQGGELMRSTSLDSIATIKKLEQERQDYEKGIKIQNVRLTKKEFREIYRHVGDKRIMDCWIQYRAFNSMKNYNLSPLLSQFVDQELNLFKNEIITTEKPHSLKLEQLLYFDGIKFSD